MWLSSLFFIISTFFVTEIIGKDDVFVDSKDPSLRFTTELPSRLTFANSTGTKVVCEIDGNNSPVNISWRFIDGKLVDDVSGLRIVKGGVLEFLSFSAEKFRPDVHSTVYYCSASNNIGTIRSVDVHVHGVVVQNYEAQVYDVYAMEGNTAVLKCHIPSVMSDYIKTVAWIKNNNLLIQSAFETGFDEKYAVVYPHYLHIRNVNMNETGSNYKCKTENILTGETRISPVGGHIFVTETQGNVLPKITSTVFSLQVNEGENVTIPCVGQGKPAPKLKWFQKKLNGQMNEINKNTHISTSLSSLTITNAQITHSGVYICELFNINGRVQQDFMLNVNGKLKARINPAVKISKFGDVVLFNCESQSNLDSTISWMHNGKLMPSPSNPNLTLTAGVSSQGFYQCFIKNEMDVVQSTAELKLSEIAPYFDETFKDINVQPKSSVTVKCVASGIPPPKIIWMVDEVILKNNQFIEIVSSKNEEGKIVSQLKMKKIMIEDGGLYSCVATNNFGESRNSARISVHGPLMAKKTIKVVAVSGKNAYLNCPVYGYPIEETIWTGSDNKSISFKSQYRVYSNGTLWIKNVHRQTNNGKYFCTVKNSLNQIATSSVEMEVVVPPKIVPFEFQDELLREGMRARLQCVVSEGDAPINVTWLKDDKRLSNISGIVVRSLDDFSSILTINNILPSHNGVYTCVASNLAAVASHSTILSVNVPPKIVPFRFGSLLNEGSSTRIMCGLQEGDLPIHFSWLHNGNPVIKSLFLSIFSTDSFSSILSIEKLSFKHTGNYTCVARNGAGETQYEAALIINVPPKIVPFEFQEEQLIEGQLARLSCIVSRGDLPLQIWWEKDGHELNLNSAAMSIKSFDEYSSILSIHEVSSNHNGVYTCFVKNSAGFTSFSSNLFVKVPPRWIHEPNGTAFVLNNTRVVIDCQSDGYPKPTIEWIFSKSDNEKRLPVNNDENRHISSNGSLIIDRVSTDNEGFYVCKTSNGFGIPLESVIEIKINAPPLFNPELQNMKVAIGKNVQWQCIVHGDKPMEIKWLRHNKSLNYLDNRIVMQTVNDTAEIISSLTIHKVSRDDSGLYQCIAKNSYGSKTTASNLTVVESPNAPTNLRILSQSSTTVELEWKLKFNGNDGIKKFIIQYKKEKSSWDDAITMETVNGEPKNSIIAHLSPASTYNLRIFAENSIGKSLASQILTLHTDEDVPSGAPLDVEVESVNPTTLKVEWKAPDDRLWNGKILGFSVGYKNAESEESFYYKTLLTPDPRANPHSILISDMKQFTKYAIVVQAYTSKGKGPLSEPVVAMTSEGAPTIAPSDVRCTTLTSQIIHITWNEISAELVHGILRGYKVSYKTMNDFEEGAERSNITSAVSMTLKNLDKFTNYSIQVAAATKSAEGPKSTPIYCKTLDDVPEAPADIKAAAASESSIIVSWKPPGKSNGIIKSYFIYFKEAESLKEPSLRSVPFSTMNYELSSLKKDTYYEVWVTSSTLVGEGSPSRKMKVNSMGPKIPAKIISFGEKIITGWNQDITLDCLAVGFPDPQTNWVINGKLVENNSKTTITPNGKLVIKNIQEIDEGSYVCTVKNDMGEDKIMHLVTVLAPPHSPAVDVNYISTNSINISWRNPPSKIAKIKGYIIHLRKEGDDWKEINLEANALNYKIEFLECGTRYEIIVFAFNRIGISLSSDILIVSTNGSVPSPPVKSDLIEEATNSVSLYLNTWKSNGCPIMYYSVEYAPRSSNEWTLISNDVKPAQRRLVIPNLKSGTWYGLRMTAHNSAGTYVAEYNFATLTNFGATISPEFQADAASEDFDGLISYLNFYLIVPVICTIIVLLAILGAACFYIKMKKRELIRSRDLDNQMSVAGTLRPGARSGSFSYMQRRNLSSSERGQITGNYQEDELVPYATFQLGNNTINTMGRHGKIGVPLPPPPHFEGFPGSGVQELSTSGNGGQENCPIETTFFFPHFQNEEGMQLPVGMQFPVNYPHQAETNVTFK